MLGHLRTFVAFPLDLSLSASCLHYVADDAPSTRRLGTLRLCSR